MSNIGNTETVILQNMQKRDFSQFQPPALSLA